MSVSCPDLDKIETKCRQVCRPLDVAEYCIPACVYQSCLMADQRQNVQVRQCLQQEFYCDPGQQDCAEQLRKCINQLSKSPL